MDLLLDIARTVSLAILLAGLIVFTAVTSKYRLWKQVPYQMALAVGWVALVIRLLVTIDGFYELPDYLFLFSLPLWFAFYGSTFLLFSRDLHRLARLRAQQIEDVITETVREGMKLDGEIE